MFWNKPKKEINTREYQELSKRIATIELDIALITDRLTKAIVRKAIKKKEEPEEENNKNPVILPE
jgi:hypothetical protein